MNSHQNARSPRTKPVLFLSLLTLSTSAAMGTVVYWDLNDTAPGAGITPNGTWDAGGASNWNTDPTGAGFGMSTWTPNDTAVFSAGTDAVGEFTVNVIGNQVAAGLTVEEGHVIITGNAINVGNTGVVTVATGAKLSIPNFVGGLTQSLIGTTVGGVGPTLHLDGSTLRGVSNAAGLTFLDSDFTVQLGPLGGVFETTNTGTNSTIFTGKIFGPGATLTKTGTGEFRYQNVNTQTASFSQLIVDEGLFRLGSVLSAESVQLTAETGFGAVPAVFTPDAIILRNGGSIGQSFGVTLNANRGITLGPGGGGFVTAAGSIVVPGAITGEGPLNKLTNGTVTLNGSNSYTGDTIVNDGIIIAGSATALGTVAGTTQIGSGGEVRITGSASNFVINEPFQIAGGGETTGGGGGAIAVLNSATPTFAGIITMVADAAIAASSSARPEISAPIFANGNHTLTLRGDSATGGLVSGPIGTGSGALIKDGVGRWRLSGSNAYSGTTTVNAGTLQFVKRQALYGGLPANWTTANIIVNSGATLAVNVGGTDEYTSADLDVLTAMGSATGGLRDGSTLAVDTSNAVGGSFTHPGVIANPNGGANMLGFTKIGTGTFVLNGANTNTGPTRVTGGTLALGPAGSIADASSLLVNGASAVFDLGLDHSETVGLVTLQGGGTINGTGTSTLLSATTFEMQSGTVNAILGGTSPLNKTGTGNVTLAGANTYTGITTISEGSLTVPNLVVAGGASSLGNASTPIVLGGATTTGSLLYTGPSATLTRSLDVKDGGGRLANNTAGQTLTLASDVLSLDGGLFTADGAGDIAISSTVALGEGGLTKAGNGTLILNGDASYFGATTVSAGTALVNGSLSGTAQITVQGTLGGTGQINPGFDGSVTLQTGGKLSPGASGVGTLEITLSGISKVELTAALSSPGSLLFELDTPGTSDKVIVNGPLDIGAGVLDFSDFAFTLLPGFDNGDYVLFDGVVPITGTLGVNLAGTLDGRTATLQLADNGNDLVLHVVPEPGAAALLLGGLALVAGGRRRARS